MKTEDQITKDKEAVAKMAGAKEAMAASLRRIEVLEGALKQASSNLESLGKLFTADVLKSAYTNGGWKSVPVKDIILENIAAIQKVL